RSMPERSMRLHRRFEGRQESGEVIGRYADSAHNSNIVLASIDEERCPRWSEKETAVEFLDYRLYAMFYWDPLIHQSDPGREWEQKLRRSWSPSTGNSIQRR